MADAPMSDAAEAEKILGELERAIGQVPEKPTLEQLGTSEGVDILAVRRKAKIALEEIARIVDVYEQSVKSMNTATDTEARVAQIKAEAGL
jgi:hypothetical protein